jgi:hypothetical protein
MSRQTAQAALTLRRSRALFLITWQLNGPVRFLCCAAVRIADPQHVGSKTFRLVALGAAICQSKQLLNP